MGYHLGGCHNSGHGILLFCGVLHLQEFLSSFNLVPVMLGKWKKSPHAKVSECKAWSGEHSRLGLGCGAEGHFQDVRLAKEPKHWMEDFYLHTSQHPNMWHY